MVKGSNLSLEILPGENDLVSLSKCEFSFKMAPYVRSLDIRKCYTQVRTAGDFLYASLNIWFEDMATFKKPVVVLRDSLSLGNPVAGLIVEIICFLHFDPEIRKKKIQ